MKILMINHFPLVGSGSGVYTMNIAKSLRNKGHEVCIIMPENVVDYKIEDGIRFHPVFFKGKEEIPNQLDFNFPCFTTHPNSTTNFFDLTDSQIEEYITAFRKAIREEVVEFEPDIIHGQHIWILSDLATEYDIPLIVTAHGTDIVGHQRSDRFHPYTNDVASKCAQIITISNDNKELVEKEFPQANGKTILIRNGYDSNVFYKDMYNKENVLKRYGIEKSYDKVVCFVGKLTGIKGVDTLLRATAIYEDDDTATLIAGNGELFDELTAMSNDLGLSNTYFLGNLPQDELRAIYNIADVSCVPSRFEAFGLVAIEALACGTPVVASAVGGIPDFLKSDVGVLISVDDSQGLATNIKKILSKELNFNSHHIVDYAYSNYAQETLIDELIKIYGTLLPGEKKKSK